MLQLPIGQLVEVLDQSDVNWLVCTVSSNGDHQPVEGFVPSKCLRPHKSGEFSKPRVSGMTEIPKCGFPTYVIILSFCWL